MEVLLEIRLLGTTFWRGLSNHQAATAQMHLVEKNIVGARPGRFGRGSQDLGQEGGVRNRTEPAEPNR